MNGVKYKPEAVVMTGITDEFPVFVKILHLYIVDHTRGFIYVQMLQTKSFDSHNHCFVVKVMNTFSILNLEEVNDYHHQLYLL